MYKLKLQVFPLIIAVNCSVLEQELCVTPQATYALELPLVIPL